MVSQAPRGSTKDKGHRSAPVIATCPIYRHSARSTEHPAPDLQTHSKKIKNQSGGQANRALWPPKLQLGYNSSTQY